MMTSMELYALVAAIEVEGYSISLSPIDDGRVYKVCVAFEATNSHDASGIEEMFMNSCGYVCVAWPDYVVVEAVYDAVVSTMIHELREKFYMNGKRIYDPHLGLGTLSERAMDKPRPRPYPLPKEAGLFTYVPRDPSVFFRDIDLDEALSQFQGMGMNIFRVVK